MSTLWTNIWDFVWLFFWAFAFIAYLITLFNVVADLFRDDKLNGWWKALWLIFLVFLPFLTVLVYLIARGRSMAERRQRDVQRAEESATSYIREVAGTSPADEIAKAKSLLDSGVITADEYNALKAKALA